MLDYDQFTDSLAGSKAASHPNPMFDYLTGFTPRKLKDLFRQAEYIGFNSAHIYGTVRKFGEYPITRFVYETNGTAEKEEHETLFEKQLRLKSFLTLVSFDIWLTGNSFVSLYEPIKRDLKCSQCGIREDIAAAKYSFNLDKLQFHFDCRACGRLRVLAEVIDEPLRDPNKMKLIRWDPKLIDIDANPITGECVYYYTIPRSLVADVRAGNKNKINHMPMEFLASMKEKKAFRFAENAIYHMRMPGPAGVESQWGYPPITAAIKMFFFASILRRANEAIALEHITPFRIMHPLAASGQGDPLTTLNLQRWRQELEANYKAFRRDPLRLMFSPIPVGVQNVGGEGKTLLTLGELQQAEENIVLSLGVPIEFLKGGLGQTRGEITLRMIENQLRVHIENLNGLIEWVEGRSSSFLKRKSIPVKLADFKMIDDEVNKQFKMQGLQTGAISKTTAWDTIDVDLKHEREQIKQEALDDARMQAELQIELAKQQQALSMQAQQRAMQSAGAQAYDPAQVFAVNTPIAEELSRMDPGSRRNRLDQIKTEDGVAYAVLRVLLEQIEQNQDAEMKAQSRGAA